MKTLLASLPEGPQVSGSLSVSVEPRNTRVQSASPPLALIHFETAVVDKRDVNPR